MSDIIKRYKKYIFEALFFAALLAVDLISKPLAFAFLKEEGGRYVVYDGIFELIEVHNDGASFGIFGGKTTGLIAVTAIAMFALIALLLWRPNSPKLFRYGIIAIVAGGVGNLVDRLAFGYVRDFIDYTFLKTFFGIENFGVGNVADIFVLVGLLCIIVYVFFGYKEGDFAKKPLSGGALPETLVVDEGEEKKSEKEKQKSGVTESVTGEDKVESKTAERATDNGASGESSDLASGDVIKAGEKVETLVDNIIRAENPASDSDKAE